MFKGMGYKLVDDFSGEDLPRDHEGLTLVVGSKSWNLHLSDDSKDALYKALEAFTKTAEVMDRDLSRKPSAAKSEGRGRKPVDTYGYDFNDVRAWAIANKVKAKSGKPITESTRVLNQDVYDLYKEAIK